MSFLIRQTLIYAIPLMVVALAGIFAERSGIINLALEGIMIFGAFIGVLFVRMMQAMGWFEAAKAADNWVALQGYLLLAMLVAAILGAVFSLLLAFAAINLRADQTIGGTALNMLAPALVLFLVRLIAKQNQLLLLKGDSASWFMIKKTMLGFDRTAELNFFQETFLNKVYLSNYVCVLVFIILAIILYKTKFGLRLRACGETPGGGFAGHQCKEDALCRHHHFRRAGRYGRLCIRGDHRQLLGQRRCGGLRLPGAGGYDLW